MKQEARPKLAEHQREAQRAIESVAYRKKGVELGEGRNHKAHDC